MPERGKASFLPVGQPVWLLCHCNCVPGSKPTKMQGKRMGELIPTIQPQCMKGLWFGIWLLCIICVTLFNWSSEFEAQHWREAYIHAADGADLLCVSTGVYRHEAGQERYSQPIQPWLKRICWLDMMIFRNTKDEQPPRASGFYGHIFVQAFSHYESTTSYFTTYYADTQWWWSCANIPVVLGWGTSIKLTGSYLFILQSFASGVMVPRS